MWISFLSPLFHPFFIFISTKPNLKSLLHHLGCTIQFNLQVSHLFSVSLEEYTGTLAGWIHTSLTHLLVPAKLETLFEKVFSGGVTSQGERKKALLAS